jgi:hypothetical protein
VHDAEAAGDGAHPRQDRLGHDLSARTRTHQRAGTSSSSAPSAASIAAHASRKDVSSYLFDRARLPAAVPDALPGVAWARWMKIVDDDHMLPMTGEPDNIKVVVSGGPGAVPRRPVVGMTRSVTCPWRLR